MDLVSIRHCQVIDDHKRTERRLKAAEAGDACRLSHMLWSGLQHEVFQEDGLDAFSDALRTNEKLSQCPLRFQRTAEWLRRDLAQFLYDSLVASDVQSFSKLKSYTSQIPWFMLRATFKLTNKRSIFKRALSDLFLSRPYGSNGSLLERLLAVFLRDTRSTEQLTECRSRIGSISICEKLRKCGLIKMILHGCFNSCFRVDVYSERDVKQTVRRHAELYDLPLVVTIARGGATALDQFDLERVLRAAKRWKRAEETTGSPPSGQAIKVISFEAVDLVSVLIIKLHRMTHTFDSFLTCSFTSAFSVKRGMGIRFEILWPAEFYQVRM